MMPEEFVVYPWNQQAWEVLSAQQSKLPHALLMTGVSGLGKLELSLSLSRLLLCDNHQLFEACGACRNCRLFAAGNHPDFHVVTSEDEAYSSSIPLLTTYAGHYLSNNETKAAKRSNIVSIDQIRRLIGALMTTPHTASLKIALLPHAERMNINAANALLKLLEEPPKQTILILVSSEAHRLPSTIRSRCMPVGFALPQRDVVVGWLQQHGEAEKVELCIDLASGIPLQAYDLLVNGGLEQRLDVLERIYNLLKNKGNAVTLASELMKYDVGEILLWIQRLLAGWAYQSLCGQSLVVGEHDTGLTIDKRFIETVFQLYDKICFYRRHINDQLNVQLALEEILINMIGVLKKAHDIQ